MSACPSWLARFEAQAEEYAQLQAQIDEVDAKLMV
jgi:hypothetical protein